MPRAKRRDALLVAVVVVLGAAACASDPPSTAPCEGASCAPPGPPPGADCPALRARICGIHDAKPNAPLTIEVNGIGPCTATLSEGPNPGTKLVTLTVQDQPRGLGPSRLGCVSDARTTCVIPPLPSLSDGIDHEVKLAHSGASTQVAGYAGDGVAKIWVRPNGKQESCVLPPGDPEIDVDAYPHACASDLDCRSVAHDPCDPCAPLDGAITYPSLAFYRSELLVRKSECWTLLSTPTEPTRPPACPGQDKYGAKCVGGSCVPRLFP